MKNKQIIDSWNKINPDSAADERMLKTILLHNASGSSPRRTSRSLTKKFALVSMVAIIMLSATALSVAHYFGSFDRLREIVGDERADILQPIQVGSVVGAHITDTAFSVEVVAVAISSNVIDLYLTIEDLVSNRLDNDFSLFARLHYTGHTYYNLATRSVTQFSNIINRTDDGIVTLHKREVFTHPIAGQELRLNIHEILYNFRTGELAVDFDLSTAIEQTPVAQLWDTPILPLHIHDIDLALEGFENVGKISISGIGIIDGRLHIQEHFDSVSLSRWPANRTELINPQGEIVLPLRGTSDNTATISFGIDEQGNAFNDRGYNFATFFFRENVYEVNLERLAEYRIVALFDTYDHSSLTWSAVFEVEIPSEITEFLSADGLDIWIERYSSTIESVQISPYSILFSGIQGLHNEYPETAMWGLVSVHVKLHMADGTVVDSSLGWARMCYETRVFTNIRYIDAQLIDLESVISVEIDGHVIELR